MAIQVGPEGRRVAFGSVDGSVMLWDWDWDEANQRLVQLKSHGLPVHDVQFSRDGRLLVSAGDDETARVTDLETSREIFTLTGHRGAVLAAAFSPDGKQVATASADGTARVWELDLLPIATARKPRELTQAERERFEIAPEK
jgi:WD40 repeat protein